MGRSTGNKVLIAIALWLVDFVITGFVTCYLWNNTMSRIFGLMQITYWQGWAVSLLIGYFKPKNWDHESDTIKDLTKDIVNTLLIALFMWLLITFAGI